MPEQSHKREMDAALRGDFARLRERGVTPTLDVRDAEPGPGGAAPTPSPAAVETGTDDPRERPEPTAPLTDRSWLDRMLGRE